jgi:hypothetical protein
MRFGFVPVLSVLLFSFFFFLFSFFFYIHRYFDFRYIICAEDEDELDDEGIDVGTPKHVCRQCQTHGRA